jgi:hypothetical protein
MNADECDQANELGHVVATLNHGKRMIVLTQQPPGVHSNDSASEEGGPTVIGL